MIGIYEEHEIEFIGYKTYYKKNPQDFKMYRILCTSCNSTYDISIKDMVRRESKFCTKCYIKEYKGIRGVGTKLYSSWANMMQRCTNANHPKYKYYGATGVTVCDEWMTFVNFRDWAESNGHSDNLTIERKDSNKNYHPNNCEWITQSENSTRANNRDNMRRKYIKIRSSDIPNIMEAKTRGVSNKILASNYKCSQATISDVVRQNR